MSAVRQSWMVLAAGLLALTLILAGVGSSNARIHQSGPHDGHRVGQLEEAQSQQVGKTCPRRCQLGQYLAADLATFGSLRPAERVSRPLPSDPRIGAWLSLVETGPPKV